MVMSAMYIVMYTVCVRSLLSQAAILLARPTHDAQLWATAKLNQIPVIFSEDFNSGATLEGARFVNPFASTFRMDDWM